MIINILHNMKSVGALDAVIEVKIMPIVGSSYNSPATIGSSYHSPKALKKTPENIFEKVLESEKKSTLEKAKANNNLSKNQTAHNLRSKKIKSTAKDFVNSLNSKKIINSKNQINTITKVDENGMNLALKDLVSD